MYKREPRFGVEFPTGTPAEVGPFTYIFDDPLYLKRVNVVPFASTAERPLSLACRTFTDALYNAKEKKNVVGGHPLRNKAKRFVYKDSGVPPPGTYNPKYPEKRKNIPLEVPPGKGRVYYCRVPFTFMGSAPSIPTKADVYGYDIGPRGIIKKNEVPPFTTFPGPSTYNIQDCDVEDPYKGCQWSRRTAERKTIDPKQGPGPAEYNISKVSLCRRDQREIEYREMARRFSYLPRYTEQLQCTVKRENFPAPSKYNLPSSFDYKPSVTTVVKPFITRKPRFGDGKEGTDAIYEIAGTIGDRPTPSIKQIPFSSTAVRFKRKKVSENDPQPGFNYLKGFTDVILEKNSKPYVTFRAPFDTLVKRDTGFVPKDSQFKPGPATYPRENIPGSCATKQGNSVFVSSGERLKDFSNQIPAPSSYDAIESFNQVVGIRSHNKKKLPFQATAERKTVILPLKDNPGPADYLGKKGIGGKGFPFTSSKRFILKDSGVPPPDHYFIHPMYGESLYNTENTCNLIIAEMILRKKLRVPPKESWKEYIRTLKKKKKLRCYATFLEA